MSRLHVFQLRLLTATSHIGEWAAWMELAAGRQFDQIGRRAGNRSQIFFAAFECRHGVDQADGVGMYRFLEGRLDISDFDDLASIHRRDTVSEFGGEREVVLDEDEREIEFLAQFFEHVHDVALRQNVERSRRFVEDEQLRLQQQAERNEDALPHAAGQFVRK